MDNLSPFELPWPVLQALHSLNRAGHEAWLVGGCVRDHYLGRTPGDYDIATSALPRQTQAVFAAQKTLETGLAHGTLTLLLGGMALEITTFRADGIYTDHRRPDSVRFVEGLREDLARRDFTCNAMAYHPQHGLRDPFMGRADCDRGLLRAVGEPARRFEEDALRILRALRFACQLGFDIEENTLDAMMAARETLGAVSAERVAQELNRALTGSHAASALRAYPRVLFAALPDLAPMLHTPQRTPFHMYDVWEHTLYTLDYAPADTAIRWAALYHDSGKPHATQIDPDGTTHFRGHQAISARLMAESLARLKQSKALREECVTLVRYHDERIGPDNLRLFLSRLGGETTLKLLRLQRADLAAHSPLGAKRVPQLDELYEDAQRILQSGEALRVRDLAIGGEDLAALGYRRDASLGRALEKLLDRVLRGKLANEKEALAEQAREWLENSKP